MYGSVDQGNSETVFGPGQRGIRAPKWGKIRQVALPWDVVGALEVAKTRATSPLVFPGPMVGGYRGKSSISKVIERAAKRGNLGKHVHPHMLRHSYASHLVMRGVNLRVVQDLLGHATLEMTMRYAHLSPDHKAEAVQVLAEDRGLRLIDGGQDTDNARGPRGGRQRAGEREQN